MATVKNSTLEDREKIHQLPAVRYSYNITLDPLDMTSLRAEFKGHAVPKENKDPLLRTRRALIEFYTQLRNIDKEARILTWKEKKNITLLPEDEKDFPNVAVTIASFFEGLNPRKKQGRLYFRIRIHTPNSQDRIHT